MGSMFSWELYSVHDNLHFVFGIAVNRGFRVIKRRSPKTKYEENMNENNNEQECQALNI